MKYTTCLQDECIVYAPCTSKTNCHTVGLKPVVPNLAQRVVYSRLFKYALQVSQRTAVGPHTSQGPPRPYISERFVISGRGWPIENILVFLKTGPSWYHFLLTLFIVCKLVLTRCISCG